MFRTVADDTPSPAAADQQRGRHRLARARCTRARARRAPLRIGTVRVISISTLMLETAKTLYTVSRRSPGRAVWLRSSEVARGAARASAPRLRARSTRSRRRSRRRAPRRRRWSSGRRCRARRRPASNRDRGPARGAAGRGRRRSGPRACRARAIRSRRRGRACARRRASPSTARRAPAARPGCCRIAWSTAASRISSNMSSRLLHAAPSAPSDTVMPRARISGTGAMPEPSFRFEPGQCITLTSWSARRCCSRSSTQTQCAAHRCGRREVAGCARYSRLARPPVQPRTIAISSRDSDACVCTSALLLGRECATASSSSREHETAKRGAKAARRRPSAAPCHRLRMATGSRRSTPASPPGAAAAPGRRSPSCTCRSSRAGRSPRPLRTPTSVSCTVSIVSTAVVPLAEQLGRGQPRRRAERFRRVRRFHRPDARAQPVHQRQIVRVAAKQRLAEVDVRLDESGQDVAAARVDDAVVRRRDRRDRWRRSGRRGSTRRPTMSKRSFIVRMVPPRMSREHDISDFRFQICLAPLRLPRNSDCCQLRFDHGRMQILRTSP